MSQREALSTEYALLVLSVCFALYLLFPLCLDGNGDSGT